MPPVDVLAINDEMRGWVASKTARDRNAYARLRRLLRGMIDDGLLSLDYDLNLSLTAEETFTRREGNCLSFSVLFVALARQAGLDAQFQMVDIPPSFTAEGELVLLNNHINVRISGIRTDVYYAQDHVVDFNTAEYDGNYETRVVTDAYAESLYHGNVAVEAMQRSHFREAFRHLKRGIELAPSIAGLWVNLGVLYSRNGQHEMAESAYLHALQVEPRNRSALVNLVNVTRYLGKIEESSRYERRIQQYLRSNPYYYQHLAQNAFDEERYDEALRLVARAIRLKDDEHQFYRLEGQAYYRSGRPTLAARSFENAERAAAYKGDQRTYAQKLEAIRGD